MPVRVNPNPNPNKLQPALERLIKIHRHLEKAHALYPEMDQILATLEPGATYRIRVKGRIWEVEIRDNFASTNVAFRAAAVRRLEPIIRKKKE